MTPNELVEIALVGMQFHVRVGVLAHEHELAQPLEVDLTVRHHMTGSSVLDYRGLYDAVRLLVEQGPLRYLEPLAEAIASAALAMDHVEWCRVVIRKPHVSLGGPLAYAHVAVERTRE